jgi:AsmA protein
MKKWVNRIAALLVAIIVILLVLPFLIPVAWVKDQIVAQVKSATGRDFVINGSTRLSLLPSITVETKRCQLRQSAWDGRRDDGASREAAARGAAARTR